MNMHVLYVLLMLPALKTAQNNEDINPASHFLKRFTPYISHELPERQIGIRLSLI